ncbi:hypothetical protein BDY21DRAFT_291810 [Lineolata rhizophorae]|uniref:Alpha-ketoglutarate-dependent dioxygenase AlkB-like domain-containing protein n=1 Tax=Lineolata rhizophorae TaxID=578093 RepID=A0A6A6NRI4_9PEZI|nr:hypothetical protein BDY21DRAFT_291810 [Lineolata rhizophorae]
MHASGTLPILQAPPQASEGIIRNWTRFHHNNAVTLPTTIQPSQLHNYDFAPLSPSPLYSTVLHSQFHFQGPPSALEPVASSNANAENATRKRGRPRKSALLPSGLLEATSANDQSSPAPESQPAAKKQKTLKIQEPENERPAPRGEPLVWADDRTALCESLPYFRAYQGACYSNECRSKSFLFDKYSHSRDIITDKVVLARAGGGMSRKSLADEMEQSKDQENSSHVRSTINSMELYVPVVIIFGNENSKIKSKMPHIYNVGDFFKITHVWYEKSDGLIVIRFRFEKLDHKCPGWWHPQDQESSQLGAYGPIHNQTCTCCGHSSPQVYKQYWICLNHACEQFWKPGDNNSPHIAEDSLEYDERFLHAFTPWPSSIAPYPLRPALMPLEEYHNIRSDESENAIKGIVCPKCGRCTGRGEFYGLVCGNPNCDFTYKAPKEVIPPIALHDRLKPRTSGFAIHFSDWWDSHIRLQVTLANNYRTHRYDIPGIGSVFHMMANKVVNEEKGGPDDMFVELQEKVESLGLERRYLKEGKLNHRTNHFSMNFGMPYKYVAKNPSKSFEEAPDAVRETRSRMEWACRQCLGNGWDGTNHHGFNELLCVGYHGKNKMDYHDDGEKGLGPVVAALSIGYPADMRFRLKSKHFTGRMRQGNLLLEPPILDWACQNAEFRKAALSELAQVEGSEARSQKIGGIEAQLKARTKGRLGKDILTMSLNHGDIMIMSGAAIQEYIEHTVVPLGRKRFALTCRYIDPSSVDKDHQPPYAVEEDKIKYDGRALAQPSSE